LGQPGLHVLQIVLVVVRKVPVHGYRPQQRDVLP
jgi:hypothetical protein